MLIDIVNENDKIYINGTKKILIPLIKDKKFKKVLKETINELNQLFIVFIEANGHDVKQLQENNTNLNEILSSNKNYKEFISKYIFLQESIESAQYISENPIYLQRKIDKSLDGLRELVERLYKDHKPKYKVSNIGSLILSTMKKTFLYSSISFLVIFLALVAYILIQELLIRL